MAQPTFVLAIASKSDNVSSQRALRNHAFACRDRVSYRKCVQIVAWHTTHSAMSLELIAANNCTPVGDALLNIHPFLPFFSTELIRHLLAITRPRFSGLSSTPRYLLAFLSVHRFNRFTMDDCRLNFHRLTSLRRFPITREFLSFYGLGFVDDDDAQASEVCVATRTNSLRLEQM